MKEMRWLGMATWLITGLSALNTGLKAFGWDMMTFVSGSLPWLVMPIVYLVGLSGVISLLFFFKSLATGGKCCE